MPAAAKLMADNRMPAGSVSGTGKDGRITKGDVIASTTAKTAAPVAAPSSIPTLEHTLRSEDYQQRMLAAMVLMRLADPARGACTDDSAAGACG